MDSVPYMKHGARLHTASPERNKCLIIVRRTVRAPKNRRQFFGTLSLVHHLCTSLAPFLDSTTLDLNSPGRLVRGSIQKISLAQEENPPSRWPNACHY